MDLIEKVTAFITRQKLGVLEILLFNHPYCGIQIPAGTVDLNENYSKAVLREVAEETGIKNCFIKSYLGFQDTFPSENEFIVSKKANVYARPDTKSWKWAYIPRGAVVTQKRSFEDYFQVQFSEFDTYPKSSYVTYQIIGWIHKDNLVKKWRRYFFHIISEETLPDQWTQEADNHTFSFFWAPFDSIPKLISPQDLWIPYAKNTLNYDFHA